MIISAIAAVAENGVIGKDGQVTAIHGATHLAVFVVYGLVVLS